MSATNTDFGWYCESCDDMVDPTSVTFGERHDTRNGGCGGKVRTVNRVRNTPTRLEAARDELLRVTLIYNDHCTHPMHCEDYGLGAVYQDWLRACCEYRGALQALGIGV